MKLPFGLGFALLLMLSNLRQVSSQELTPSADGETMGENSSGLSGDWENFFLLNQTSEDPATVLATTEEPENEEDSTTLTPPAHAIPLNFNSSKDVSLLTNQTFTQQSKNNTTSISNSTTVSPQPYNHTGLNITVTQQPKINSTASSSGSFPSNVTVVQTFQTQNSTTTYHMNSTTAYPPLAGNTTGQPTSTAGPANATTGPANATTIAANATTIAANTTLPVPDNTTDLPTTEFTRPNRTWVSFDVRGNSDRGVSPDFKQNAKSQAWGAIVGIGVAVGFVALVVYVIMKRRSQRDFSHRKLVEDMPPDPVLRLDNSEPLDLKYEGSGYYNPGVQGDNIQMTNFPRGHSN